MIKLEEKLYTSTEVAQILGVSLRSVYRYIEENKLTAEVKTATGRHRFTKHDILNFLYPNGVETDVTDTNTIKKVTVSSSAPSKGTSKMVSEYSRPSDVEEDVTEEVVVQEEPAEEPVDWLSKFREAANKFKEEDSFEPVVPSGKDVRVVDEPAFTTERFSKAPKFQEEIEEDFGPKMFYYRSNLGGLKDIAQNIDKHSKSSGLAYAFTLNAGLSLHKPIKPFSVLHAYVKSSDQAYFEKVLSLSPADEDGAQLCLIASDDPSIYARRQELHGLYVVSKLKLKEDVDNFGNAEIRQEVQSILS